MLKAVPRRNQIEYRLLRSRELASFVGERPAYFPRWGAIFPVLATVLETAHRTEGMEPIVAAVEARRALRRLGSLPARAGLPEPPTETVGEAFAAAWQDWALMVATSLSSGAAFTQAA